MLVRRLALPAKFMGLFGLDTEPHCWMLSIITGRSAPRNLVAWAAIIAGALATGCTKVPLLAPSQSIISLATSSTVVQSNGTAQVSATVINEAGVPVQNGTHV